MIVWKKTVITTTIICLVTFGIIILINRPDVSSKNENYALKKLRNILISQFGFQSAADLDQDKDGNGEYGLLNELAGGLPLRGGGIRLDSDDSYPSFISWSFRTQGLSYATVAGYHFQIFLPCVKGVLTDSDKIETSSDRKSIDAQEQYYIIYAWPVKAGFTGNRCFVLYNSCVSVLYNVSNKSQDYINILECPNKKKDGNFLYSGIVSRPTYHAAMPADKASIITSINWEPPEDGKIAVDGQIWRICYPPKE